MDKQRRNEFLNKKNKITRQLKQINNDKNRLYMEAMRLYQNTNYDDGMRWEFGRKKIL
jgi:hypothetical protein